MFFQHLMAEIKTKTTIMIAIKNLSKDHRLVIGGDGYHGTSTWTCKPSFTIRKRDIRQRISYTICGATVIIMKFHPITTNHIVGKLDPHKERICERSMRI